MSSKRKFGFIDSIIEKLPEIHIKGYNFCGCNTDLKNRLARGELGINKLDLACMEHDIAYAESKDLISRCKADKQLISKAIRCVYAKDSQFGERLVALFVSGLITIKLLLSKVELLIDRFRK